MPALFRRRHVWVPTVWGWLALFLACGALGVIAIRSLYGFLSPTEPVSARILVVEGWVPVEEFDEAVTLIRQGGYERVITTGGPMLNALEVPDTRTYAERARDHLVRRGLPESLVTALSAPASAQDRSFLNAVLLREWLERSGNGAHAVNVFSSGPHSRRSRLLHRMACPACEIGIIAGTPPEYDPAAWWRTSAGARDVIGESIGWMWARFFFRPGPPGSHEERWGIPQPG